MPGLDVVTERAKLLCYDAFREDLCESQLRILLKALLANRNALISEPLAEQGWLIEPLDSRMQEEQQCQIVTTGFTSFDRVFAPIY